MWYTETKAHVSRFQGPINESNYYSGEKQAILLLQLTMTTFCCFGKEVFN